MRQVLINELTQIADVADGVRCDMAMLALNDVFEQVWGDFIGDYKRPETEFWIEAIERVKQDHPDFLFLAEVYWGFEKRLREMGFDFTYDKLFYDKLRYSTPSDIRDYLLLNERYHQHLVRFIENHDEERAITAFGHERSLAAAIILATVPGLRLFHDGQMQGRSVRFPVQLIREREEAQDPEIIRFYERLLAVCHSPAFHEGEWRMVEVNQAGEGNKTYQNLLAWQWQYTGQLKVVVVNYSPGHTDGWLKLTSGGSGKIYLHDELTGLSTEQDAQQVANQGLYIRLNPWQAQILDLTFSSGE